MSRKSALVIATVLLLLSAPLVAEDVFIWSGEYVWTQQPDEPGDIEAVFTANGDASWDVSFYFTFEGKDHVYSGTASGDLAGGSLQGNVQSDDGDMSFVFRGEIADGVFDGTHALLDEGEELDTGTIRLEG